MAQVVLVAVDLGAESGRVLAGKLSDGRFELEEIYRFPNGPVRIGEHIYWDVLRLWTDIKNGLAAAVQKFGEQVVSIGVDTWGVDFALLDANDELVGNPYHYRDKRTEGMMELAFERVGREVIYRRTGIQFMRLNTLYQLLAMVVQKAPQLRIARTLLMMPDLFHFWLSGEKVNEFTDATTTQFYDPRKGAWAKYLLRKLGIPTRLLRCPVVPAGTVLGDLRPAVADEVRATHAIKVVAPASHDTASAVAATPLSDEQAAYISSGTWSLVGTEVRQPVITDKSLRFNFTNEGGVYGTFRLLRNVTGMWLIAECRRMWAREGHAFTYEQLTQMAAEAQPFKCFVDPDDPRFLAPENMLDAVRRFCRDTQQPEPETVGEFVRCCLEGLALKYRWVLERLEELMGKRVSTVHIVGGGARNWLLNQFTADATGKVVVAGPVEATATGNALVQAIALGYLGSHAELRAVVRNSFDLRTFEPRPDERWQHAYERFCQWLQQC
ncbi:L-Rhamnulokinase [bacterium HR17]|uniref:L-Rhamnulokinase n=1 Tax=Candidatus Fervidibacter japonicus TaxID=2035412 RepID=A0A2H5XEP0_9BACT|nr:L-Rhamnulokinase [bacterium HR17]